MTRPSQAIIDLNALRHNYQLAAELSPESKNLAVIKANAYGHGAIAVAKALEDLAPAFAVACMEEALELREAGIPNPLMLLEGFFQPQEIPLVVEQNLWLMVENQQQVEQLLAADLTQPITCWIKVDTGMHRLGLPPEEVETTVKQLSRSANINRDIVLATHFACADELDNPLTANQAAELKKLAASLNMPMSMANSPALLGWPETRAEWNRPGYMLYGNTPFTEPHQEADRLKPVMSFESQVISLRTVSVGDGVGYGATWQAAQDSNIATIPVGYGDGYPRNASSGTPVLVNGQEAKLAGRVSMDMITVDVTGLDNIDIGSKVELWGKNLSVDKVAQLAGTIGYELLTRMPGRLKRSYRR